VNTRSVTACCGDERVITSSREGTKRGQRRGQTDGMDVPREPSPIDSRKLVGPKRFANSGEHRPFRL